MTELLFFKLFSVLLACVATYLLLKAFVEYREFNRVYKQALQASSTGESRKTTVETDQIGEQNASVSKSVLSDERAAGVQSWRSLSHFADLANNAANDDELSLRNPSLFKALEELYALQMVVDVNEILKENDRVGEAARQLQIFFGDEGMGRIALTRKQEEIPMVDLLLKMNNRPFRGKSAQAQEMEESLQKFPLFA